MSVLTASFVAIAAVVASTATAGVAAPRAADSSRDPAWQLSPTGVTARLRGLSVVSRRIVWASGSEGTVLRTVDGGQSWRQVGPPGVADLQFRDIEAFDARRAVALSIGPGEQSRIYRTTDGGRTWTESFRNLDPAAFYDCMAFFDQRHGLALSDPVGGRFRILSTSDGGRSWRVLPTEGMPAALPGEFAFAASGQCLVTDHGRRAWFGTGGGAQARVFRSDDGGATWQVSATPIHSGPTAGIFALAFRGQQHGFAVGGDFLTPTVAPDSLAVTSDGGATWQLVADAPNEYRSGAAWVTGQAAVAVGPSGSDATRDAAQTWERFDSGSFDTVDCAHNGACWASGEKGRAAYLVRAP